MQDNIRWARILCELLREVWQRADKSAWPAHLELIAKLQVAGISAQLVGPLLAVGISTRMCQECLGCRSGAETLLDSNLVGSAPSVNQ